VIRGNRIYNARKSVMCTAALEAAEHGIRVNEVAPGAIETPMLREFLAHAAAAGSTLSETDIAAAAPLKRIGTPEDVAAAILFLRRKPASLPVPRSRSIAGFG
jgi:NAD(P)-dependent dehydrogenase (short-subunit alcohol dehydrogenase family)